MKNILYIIAFLSATVLNAQQEPLLTLYTFNPMQFNPAYAGHRGPDLGSATLQYRNQWIGVNGSPKSYLGAVEKSLFDHRIGVGFTVSHEGIGAISQNEVAISSNYRIKLKKMDF